MDIYRSVYVLKLGFGRELSLVLPNFHSVHFNVDDARPMHTITGLVIRNYELVSLYALINYHHHENTIHMVPYEILSPARLNYEFTVVVQRLTWNIVAE